jgi:hypothetical protein
MQDYLGLIEKQKENAKIFNDYMIEARSSADLAQKVFYGTLTSELKERCKSLHTACEQVILSAESLMSILLIPDSTTTDEA